MLSCYPVTLKSRNLIARVLVPNKDANEDGLTPVKDKDEVRREKSPQCFSEF